MADATRNMSFPPTPVRGRREPEEFGPHNSVESPVDRQCGGSPHINEMEQVQLREYTQNRTIGGPSFVAGAQKQKRSLRAGRGRIRFHDSTWKCPLPPMWSRRLLIPLSWVRNGVRQTDKYSPESNRCLQ